MKVVTNEETAVIAAENEINHLSSMAVHELQTNARDAQIYGYDFVELSTIERGIIGLATLAGAERVSSLDAALTYLQNAVESLAEKDGQIEDLEKTNTELIEKLEVSDKRVESFESVLSARDQGATGILLETGPLKKVMTALESSQLVLDRVAGQRALSMQAFHALRLLEIENPLYLIPVDESELAELFPTPKGSARSI